MRFHSTGGKGPEAKSETTGTDVKIYKRIHYKMKLAILLECLGSVATSYCNECTVCGLRKIVEFGRSLTERLLWAAILLLGMLSVAVLIVLSSSEFVGSPLATAQVPLGTPIADVNFPAVAICTSTRLSAKAVRRFAQEYLQNGIADYGGLDDLLAALRSAFLDLVQASASDTQIQMICKIFGNLTVDHIMNRVMPQCADVLVRCRWEGRRQDCAQLLARRLTTSGYCCLFNYLGSANKRYPIKTSDIRNDTRRPRRTEGALLNGLSVLFNAGEDDNFLELADPTRIFIFNSLSYPIWEGGTAKMVMVRPGTEVTLNLGAVLKLASSDLTGLRVEQRHCVTMREYQPSAHPYGIYTYADCVHFHRVRYIHRHCGCVPFNFPQLRHSRVCRLEDYQCSIKRENETRVLTHVEGSGGCVPTCYTTQYPITTITSRLDPSKRNRLAGDLFEDWLLGAPFNGNQSIISIRFVKTRVTTYITYILYHWYDLASSIGATCGFVSGFSFISLVELFYFFTVKLYRRYKEKLDEVCQQPELYWSELIPKAKH